MEEICPHCDPKYFVLYGYCRICRRIGEPPLWDEDLCNFEQYKEFCRIWRREKYVMENL